MDGPTADNTSVERQSMQVDIVCVGFGPAMGGFLTALSRQLATPDGGSAIQSKAMPGMPLQVVCYERADDIAFGVSGVVTRARGIRESLPELNPDEIPLATPVTHEEVVYLLDPIKASRRSVSLRLADWLIKAFRVILPYSHHALRLPYIPPFLRKHGGLLLSIGQFNQWVAAQVASSGIIQIWPGMPVHEPLVEDGRVAGVRLVDQGVSKKGAPEAGYLPGMEIRADFTVVGDGPVGPVGRRLDEHFGVPKGHSQRDWAVGMKMVVDLPDHCSLKPGTVIHTFGYPEPEIFGFLYVYRDQVASLGIFIPSWFHNPVRTAYRYLQHWMMHPYLWRHLEGGALRSWGAKTLQESGKRGEPMLVGDGYARIGEGSGSTNVLTGSGVDEAWTTGVILANAVGELLQHGKPFTKENLEEAYVKLRRSSWVESEARAAKYARDGFHSGFVLGLIGMALAGFTKGRLSIPRKTGTDRRMPSLEEFYKGRISPEELESIRRECYAKGLSMHDAVMTRAGWPEVAHDGRLLMSHQDALLVGGKVQAPDNYADHVVFLYPELCDRCGVQLCAEMCSGQAITPNPNGGRPDFDREKCVHCGACLWNCTQTRPDDPLRSPLEFRAGTGGLHSAEN